MEMAKRGEGLAISPMSYISYVQFSTDATGDNLTRENAEITIGIFK